MLLCWHLWDSANEKNWTILATCSVLLAYAFYASVFVFLGALPFAAFCFTRTSRVNLKRLLIVAGLSLALIWPLLWIYMGKSQDVRFLFPFVKGVAELFPYFAIGQFISIHPLLFSVCASCQGMIAGFLVFVLFIGASFLLHAIALLFYRKRLGPYDGTLAAIALLFLVSTYFIGFPEGDNYASRGYMIPMLVLGWVCSQVLPEIRPRFWIVASLLLGSFGLLHEGFATFKNAMYIVRTPVSADYGASIVAMNQDRNTSTLSFSAFSDALRHDPDLIYSVEKFVEGGKNRLVVADRQLECLGPHGPWQWQQLPSKSANHPY